MAIIDIFSKRQRREKQSLPDVYRYDVVPENLRVQIVHIWNDVFVEQAERGYEQVVKILRREYGVFKLVRSAPYERYDRELVEFFLQERQIDRVLDVVEISFAWITRSHTFVFPFRREEQINRSKAALKELNGRLQEHAIGYRFEKKRIVRTDSEYVHSEVVKPALRLLGGSGYSGALDEFLKAHEYHRKADAKAAMNECLKALESVAKAVCDRRKWSYSRRATAAELLQKCFDNELVPQFWQTQFSALLSLLKSSVPTGRNRLSGHGQGADPVEVPTHLAAYLLHMTAATIVFLIEAEATSP
ncbi:MAG: hypothetical protein OXE50_15060 [Chloroflexi bacterium]|nr:hypothetical protein [Chloroflexota bacterium]